MSLLFFVGIAAFLFSFLATPIVKKLAEKLGVVDRPSERRINKVPIARLGGLAVASSFILLAILFGQIDKHLIGFLLGALVLLVFGIWDDIKNLKPWVQLLGQILAALILVASGIGIEVLSNPFGPAIHLDSWKIPLDFLGTTYHITVWSDLLTLVWVVGMVNVMNFLDGLDGLASGVSGIGSLVLVVLALSPVVGQTQVALLAALLAGASFGFLPHNFHPAKIFLGSAGSYFLGFALATLAIISGGKLATAFLVLGFPIIDGLWVAGRRLLKKKSPFQGDLSHLHHRLLAVGLTQRRAVIFIYVLCAGFGITALLASSQLKMMAMAVLLVTVIFLSVLLYFFKKNYAAKAT